MGWLPTGRSRTEGVGHGGSTRAEDKKGGSTGESLLCGTGTVAGVALRTRCLLRGRVDGCWHLGLVQ